MNLRREWVTPVTIGAFLLSAVTGIAIFFHIETGLTKVVHEWLSWLLLAAVLVHVLANFTNFKRYFFDARALAMIGFFAILLTLSFIPIGGVKPERPYVAPVRALAEAPLTTLAGVAKITPEELRKRLAKADLPAPTSDQQSLADLAGSDFRRQVHILNGVLAAGE